MKNLLLVVSLFIALTAPSWAAFTFAGTSTTGQSVQITDNEILTLPDADWAIHFRITKDSLTYLYDERVVTWGTGGATPSFNLELTGSAADADAFHLSATDGDGTILDTPYPGNQSLTIATWADVVIQRSGNTVSIYVDAVEKNNATDVNFDAINVAAALYIGKRSNAGAFRGFTGNIADFAMWNRALSSGEIAGLSAGFAAKCFPKPVVYLPMIRDYNDIAGGLEVLNDSSTVSVHPRLYDCGG